MRYRGNNRDLNIEIDTGTYVQVQMGREIRDWYMEFETETRV